MRSSRPRRLSTGRIDLRQLHVGDVMISEFMFLNCGTLVDEDGTFSAWIELHNPGDAPIRSCGLSTATRISTAASIGRRRRL